MKATSVIVLEASFFLPEPCGYDTASAFGAGTGFVTTGAVGLVGLVSEAPFWSEVVPEVEPVEDCDPLEEESVEVEPVDEEGAEVAGLVPHFPS